MISPKCHSPITWKTLYQEADLYKAAVRLYTKPLFNWRKALGNSHDEKNLYDFARHGLPNLHKIHCLLANQQFQFRPGSAVHKNFNGKQRTLYLFPWEERLVSLLLYRILNQQFDRYFSHSSYAYRITNYGIDRCQNRIKSTISSGSGLFVSQRDIKNYFDTIDHEILLSKLRQWIPENDYLFCLLKSCVQFSYYDANDYQQAQQGIPFGTAIACFFANLYLHELDQKLEEIPGLSFFRYADDFLMLAESNQSQDRAISVFETELAVLKLESKQSHQNDFQLLENKASVGFIQNVNSKFRHLGLEYRANGSIGLSRDKFRKICNLFRFAFRRKERWFRRIKDPLKRAKRLIELSNQTIELGIRNVAILDYYLRHVTDESQLKQLDRWLAEEILARSFQNGHKKGNFRKLPFKKLRELGLPSLLHRHRLIQHGKIDSPFFQWKVNKQQGYGKQTAKSGLSTKQAFSQVPEAVVNKSL